MLKYEEIVSYIEEQIENQTFIPNMKLPSLREMAGHFSTSVGTVLSAYKYLEYTAYSGGGTWKGENT